MTWAGIVLSIVGICVLFSSIYHSWRLLRKIATLRIYSMIVFDKEARNNKNGLDEKRYLIFIIARSVDEARKDAEKNDYIVYGVAEKCMRLVPGIIDAKIEVN